MLGTLVTRGRPALERSDPVMSLDEWSQLFSAFSYNGLMYPFLPQTGLGQREEVGAGFSGFVRSAYRSNGVVFSCMMVRMLLFSEARFQFQQMKDGRPGNLWGNKDLNILETPWSGATTGDLLTRAIQDADLAGNFFGKRRLNSITKLPEIRRLRPDWITIIVGSMKDPDMTGSDIDAELLGYVYSPGGAGAPGDPDFLLPEEVCHFAPIPDPFFNFRGMPWLEPIIREVMADGGFTSHKLKFLENGATPNMVVTMDPKIQPDTFNKWMEKFEAKHSGLLNAYKTLYLGGGASAAVVGSSLKDMDYKLVQGAGETRIAAAAGMPPVIVGLSEGLAAATYSNYQQSMRRCGDGTMRPLWRNLAGSMQRIINVPTGSRLWYDDRDIPWLKEDMKVLADVQKVQAGAIVELVQAGFTADSAKLAILGNDMSLLVHTGLYSTKLQPPGEYGEPGGPSTPTPTVLPPPAKPPKSGQPSNGTTPLVPVGGDDDGSGDD